MTSKNQFLDLSKYKILHSIGNGSFSNVYRVKDLATGNYYAAKISNFMVDEETEDSSQTLLLYQEVNLISLLNHPSILKFIGYSQFDFENDPRPTIITEYISNGSLRDILNLERSSLSLDDWTFTKKLINIYGIAAGMSYMHANKVIHRDLKPENILIDDYLYPKISDFGLSKINDILSLSVNFKSNKGLKGTPIYMAPEIFSVEEYTTKTDVYAFALIVYEIVTLNKPFENCRFFDIMRKVGQGTRPEFPQDILEPYKKLIEDCWDQDPDLRPSFDEIVQRIKNGKEFVNEWIDESEFYDYADYIDECKSSFDISNRFHFRDFINVHGRNKNVKKVVINQENDSDSDINDSKSKIGMDEKQILLDKMDNAMEESKEKDQLFSENSNNANQTE